MNKKTIFILINFYLILFNYSFSESSFCERVPHLTNGRITYQKYDPSDFAPSTVGWFATLKNKWEAVQYKLLPYKETQEKFNDHPEASFEYLNTICKKAGNRMSYDVFDHFSMKKGDSAYELKTLNDQRFSGNRCECSERKGYNEYCLKCAGEVEHCDIHKTLYIAGDQKCPECKCSPKKDPIEPYRIRRSLLNSFFGRIRNFFGSPQIAEANPAESIKQVVFKDVTEDK